MKNNTFKEFILMYCPQCGNRIKQNELFCSWCGYRTAGQYGVGSRQNASSAPWIIGIVAAVIALAAVISLIFIAQGNANNASPGGSSAGQIVGTWQLTTYENETGTTDMNAANIWVEFAADGTLNTSEGNDSTVQGTHWEWADQDTIILSGGNGDVIMDIAFDKAGGKDVFTVVVTSVENPDKMEIFTFVKADGAQGNGAEEGGQGTQTTQETQQDINGVDVNNMTLQELQGEWQGTGVLTDLDNIEKLVWNSNWGQMTAEEAALYNSMVGVENTCNFSIDPINDIGCELRANDSYSHLSWRGLFDEGTGTTLTNGELSATYDIPLYSCRIHAVLSADDDGVLMLRGTVDTVALEGPPGGPYEEITYSISFIVKKCD